MRFRRTSEVKGLKQLESGLKDLPYFVAAGAVTSALRASSKELVQKAKSNARRTMHPSSGALAESVGIRAGKKYRNSPNTKIFIGPIFGDRKAAATYLDYYSKGKGIGIYHGHLIEFGTEHSAARPWLRPALDSEESDIPKKFGRFLSKQIDRRVKKLRAGKPV